MKLWIGTVILLIAFSGCSDKSPNQDDQSKGSHNRSSEVAAIEEAARAHGTITDDQIEILVGYLGDLNLAAFEGGLYIKNVELNNKVQDIRFKQD